MPYSSTYDNIEIGVKSTLRREFDVAAVLDALKERGDIVAKIRLRQLGPPGRRSRAQMAENAVQMVQRIPSPRGDKNGADINLALDALEMAFTHTHVNAFAIVSGDSDFIPLVNKLKEYGKTRVRGGRQGLHLHHPAAELPRVHQLRIAAVGFHAGAGYSAGRDPGAAAAWGPSRMRDRGGDRGDRPAEIVPPAIVPPAIVPPEIVPRGRIAETAGSVPLRWNWRWPCRWWSAPCKCWSAAPCSRSWVC